MLTALLHPGIEFDQKVAKHWKQGPPERVNPEADGREENLLASNRHDQFSSYSSVIEN